MPPTSLQWLSLVGIIWLQSINGTNFNFPAYSSELKHHLSMSQLQLNNLAFASDAGKLFGWFSGIAAVHLPLWLVLLIGSTLGLIGYGLQFLFLVHQISSLSYWQVFLLSTLAGNSICWVNTVSYVVTIRNFPSNRQVAVGISTSYMGLSAKIYTDIVDLVSPSSPNTRAKAYLFLSSLLPLLVCMVSAPFVRNINTTVNNEKGRTGRSIGGGEEDGEGESEFFIVMMFVITIVTGVFAVITSLGSTSSGLSLAGNVIGLGVLLLAPLLVPLGVEIRERLKQKKWMNGERSGRVYDVEIEGINYGGQGDDEDADKVERGVVKDGDEGSRREERGQGGVKEEVNVGVKEMVQRMDFWLYFFVYIFGATIGLVYLNNLGQIAESRGYSRTSSLVSLSSSFGFFGRLVPSLLDYFFSR